MFLMICSPLLLSLLPYTTQDHLSEDWALLHQSLTKKTPFRLVCRSVGWGRFLNQGSLLPDDPSLHHITNKTTYHTNITRYKKKEIDKSVE